MPNNDPDKWEATDHIENLKRDCAADEIRCASCDDLRRAVIWIIRRMDLQDKRYGYQGMLWSMFKQSPISGAICFAAYVAGKIHGVI